MINFEEIDASIRNICDSTSRKELIDELTDYVESLSDGVLEDRLKNVIYSFDDEDDNDLVCSMLLNELEDYESEEITESKNGFKVSDKLANDICNDSIQKVQDALSEAGYEFDVDDVAAQGEPDAKMKFDVLIYSKGNYKKPAGVKEFYTRLDSDRSKEELVKHISDKVDLFIDDVLTFDKNKRRRMKESKQSDELYSYIEKEAPYVVDDFYEDEMGIIHFDINNGDWKHEHWRVQNLVSDYFANKGITIRMNSAVTEEDGSDTYSATYRVRTIGKNKDIYETYEESKEDFSDIDTSKFYSVGKQIDAKNYGITVKKFLDSCYAQGGNWTAMLMTGVKNLFPEYYEKMPDKNYSWEEMIYIMNNDLGIDTAKKESLKESDSDRFDEFDDILDVYMPANGEGDTRASQLVTALNKLIFKWFNDGDVYDNTYELAGWANDLSSYANWLYKYVPESRKDLRKIEYVETEDEYEDLLYNLAEKLFDKDVLADYETEEKVESIYNCDGPFEYIDRSDDSNDYSEDPEEWYEGFGDKVNGDDLLTEAPGDFNPLTLKKYGVVRDPANDFSDDGNRFSAYLYKGVIPITYLKADGQVYLTVAFHHLGDVNYNEYKNFDSYQDGDKYNGVPANSVDIEDFVSILERAKKDYEEFKSTVKAPNIDEYKAYRKTYADFYTKVTDKAKKLIADNIDNIANLPEYEIKKIFEYYKSIRYNLNRWSNDDNISQMSPSAIRNELSSESIERQKKEIANIDDYFYLKYIRKIIDSGKVKKEGLKKLKDKKTITEKKHNLKEGSDSPVIQKAISYGEDNKVAIEVNGFYSYIFSSELPDILSKELYEYAEVYPTRANEDAAKYLDDEGEEFYNGSIEVTFNKEDGVWTYEGDIESFDEFTSLGKAVADFKKQAAKKLGDGVVFSEIEKDTDGEGYTVGAVMRATLGEKLTEGAMSELNIEIQEAGGEEEFKKKLIDEISDLVDYLNSDALHPKMVNAGGNFDTEEEREEAVRETEKRIDELKAKLKCVNRK